MASPLPVTSSPKSCFSPLHEGDASVAAQEPHERESNCPFQSPSRGGRLCGSGVQGDDQRHAGFSPLHEGDASVAVCDLFGRVIGPLFQSPSRGGRLCGLTMLTSWLRSQIGFSPLHEGDASVAPLYERPDGWR